MTRGCELGQRSRLRHTHLRRQIVGCPRVLEAAKNRSLLAQRSLLISRVTRNLHWRGGFFGGWKQHQTI